MESDRDRIFYANYGCCVSESGQLYTIECMFSIPVETYQVVNLYRPLFSFRTAFSVCVCSYTESAKYLKLKFLGAFGKIILHCFWFSRT